MLICLGSSLKTTSYWGFDVTSILKMKCGNVSQWPYLLNYSWFIKSKLLSPKKFWIQIPPSNNTLSGLNGNNPFFPNLIGNMQVIKQFVKQELRPTWLDFFESWHIHLLPDDIGPLVVFYIWHLDRDQEVEMCVRWNAILFVIFPHSNEVNHISRWVVVQDN